MFEVLLQLSWYKNTSLPLTFYSNVYINPATYVGLSQPEHGFPKSYEVVFFAFSELRWEVIFVLLILVELLTITV
jgi:hypothetical protein